MLLLINLRINIYLFVFKSEESNNNSLGFSYGAFEDLEGENIYNVTVSGNNSVKRK